MSGDVHVRFCESRGVRLPPATHPVVMCRSQAEAEAALELVRNVLCELGLELHPEKTRIVDLREGQKVSTSLVVTFMPESQDRCWSAAFVATTYIDGHRLEA